MALLRSVGAQIGIAVENMRLREEARRADALATLLQEMHHRIKNNLQGVAGLLQQKRLRALAVAARQRIRSAASTQPRWRSIISADRISEPGLT